MDIMEIAQNLIKEKLGDVDTSNLQDAVKSLFGDNFDISNLISKVTSNGSLGDIVNSWLGDGENKKIDASLVSNLFDMDQISSFASKLGIDTNKAQEVLADVVPNIVDKASSGGNLLDSLGSMGDLGSLAKKFF